MGCSRCLRPPSSCSLHRVQEAPAGAADEDRTKTTTEAVAISWRHHHPPAGATAGLVSTEAVAISWRHRHPPTRATVIQVEANTGVARRAYSNIGLRVVTSSSA